VKIDYSGPISETINDVNLISEHLVELANYCTWFPIMKDSRDFTYVLAIALPSNQCSVTDGGFLGE